MVATPTVPTNRVQESIDACFGAGEGPPPPSLDKYHDGGRDGRGRFTKGNPGGPGNPFARQMAKLRQHLLNSASPEEIDFVKAQLMELIAKQNPLAIRMYFEFIIGKAGPAVDPDRLDIDEWRLLKETSPCLQDLHVLSNTFDIGMHLDMMRAARAKNTAVFEGRTSREQAKRAQQAEARLAKARARHFAQQAAAAAQAAEEAEAEDAEEAEAEAEEPRTLEDSRAGLAPEAEAQPEADANGAHGAAANGDGVHATAAPSTNGDTPPTPTAGAVPSANGDAVPSPTGSNGDDAALAAPLAPQQTPHRRERGVQGAS
jgi:hypothetical protein